MSSSTILLTNTSPSKVQFITLGTCALETSHIILTFVGTWVILKTFIYVWNVKYKEFIKTSNTVSIVSKLTKILFKISWQSWYTSTDHHMISCPDLAGTHLHIDMYRFPSNSDNCADIRHCYNDIHLHLEMYNKFYNKFTTKENVKAMTKENVKVMYGR